MFRVALRVAVGSMVAAAVTAAQTESGSTEGGATPTATIDYDRDVRPILAGNCFECHGRRKQQSGLRLDLRQSALRGGDYGVVIVPGKAADSNLIKRLTSSEVGVRMPPEEDPLPDHEIAVLRAWIDQGAEMPGRADESAPAPFVTDPAVQRLIDAIAHHDLDAVNAMLAENQEFAKSADGAGSTALMHAASSGTLAIMQALLAAGADVNASNGRSATALHWAAADAAKVELLLRSGAAVNAKTVEDRTPLYAAATMPNGAPAMRLLIEAGADVNAATIVGATPLFPAVNASAEATKLLLDNGADPNQVARSGVTPIMFTRDAEVVALLVASGADVRARSKVGETALMDAAARGDLTAAKLLLERGADVNATDHRGYTPLILASAHDGEAPELVRLLLSCGADCNAKAEGESALSLAARRGETEVTRILQAATARSDEVAREALETAAQKGLDLLVKTSPTFLKKGGCNSCHNQILPAAAQAFARGRGIDVGEPIARLAPGLSEATAERYAEYSVAGGGGVTALSFELFASELAGQSADARVLAQIQFIKGQQQPEGHWRGGGSQANHGQGTGRGGTTRPPLMADDFTPTAFMIRALKAYAAPGDAADTEARIAKARQWLLNARATRTQEHAFRTLGLTWSNADRPAIDAAARDLQELQQRDGGFSQLPMLPSDAYATGLALFALHEAGLPSTDLAYQSGLRFLLTTQAADGTWHVRTRALEFQPYFESGYPYGHDQWISAAGAAYATLAIAAAVEPLRTAAR
jgi:ankyrin repeat protein